MNIHFIKGEFFAGTKLIPEVELKMEKFKDMLENDFENTFKRLEKAGLVERIC